MSDNKIYMGDSGPSGSMQDLLSITRDQLAASEAAKKRAEREDSVANVRKLASERDELRLKLTETCQEAAADALAVESLRGERDELRQAVGLATTIKGDMAMDAEHPVEMMQEVADYVDELRDELRAVLSRLECPPEEMCPDCANMDPAAILREHDAALVRPLVEALKKIEGLTDGFSAWRWAADVNNVARTALTPYNKPTGAEGSEADGRR